MTQISVEELQTDPLGRHEPWTQASLALLSSGASLYAEQGLSTVLASTSLDSLAARADISIASARRSVRSKIRLDDHVNLALTRQRLSWQCAARVWAASQQGQTTGDVRGAIEAGYEGSRRLLVDRDIVSGFEAFGLLPTTLGWAHRAQVQRMIINPVAVSRTATLELVGLCPKKPFSVTDLVTDVFAGGFGTLAFATARDAGDHARDPRVEASVTALEHGFLGALELGSHASLPHDPVDESELVGPRLSLAEQHLVETALTHLKRAGLPHPFAHLSVRSVANRADSSTGLLYEHFDSVESFRDALIRFALFERRHALMQDLRRDTPVLDALVSWVGDFASIGLFLRCAGSPASSLRRYAADHVDASSQMLQTVLDARCPPSRVADRSTLSEVLLAFALGGAAMQTGTTIGAGLTGTTRAFRHPRPMVEFLLGA